MQDPFLRTLAAQSATEADWIGIFAGEQLALHMHSAQLTGTLSATGVQWLQHCLPGLEACVEAQCPVELRPIGSGLTSQYGFPRTAGYPVVVVSVLHLSPEPHSPEFAALSGTIRRWPSRPPPCLVGANEWWQVIAATQAGSWPRVSRALAAVLGGKGGAAIATQFSDHDNPTAQLVVAVLAAGNAQESCGLISMVALPAIAAPADVLRINLG